jgi:hypothetical protein
MVQGSEPLSLRFKERMAGHVAFDDLDDLIVVNDDGTGWARLGLRMDMHIRDVDAFWSGNHVGDLGGVVQCAALGGDLLIHRGRFQLMVPAEDKSHQHMNYFVEFEDTKGRALTLTGYKECAPGEFGPWEETTTTLCRVRRGWNTQPDPEEDEDGIDIDDWPPDAAGSGVLKISLFDFLWQEFTFRGDRDASLATRLRVRATFVRKFMSSLARTYLPGRRRPKGPAE